MIQIAVAALTMIVAVVGGYWFTVVVLRLADRAGRARDAEERPGPESAKAVQALRGGRWIGYLERLGVAGAILGGQVSLVAILVAIKGLGRFSELQNNPDASERFVIGSLASILWAAACGGVGHYFIS
ncbi:hypothetical protein [Rarobacter incanus]|uniref:Uncharacterized protein n=1 Tax=Rarobacter incanus TaxID=153494 RepID=A0A542SMA9_9MICO|nr:hypothetical protein [Rarobacter incanus]TQK75615.1 hypothetical protein FB389_0245 [Rarobacter incanus]